MFRNSTSKKAISAIMAAVIGITVAGTSLAEAAPPPPPPAPHHRYVTAPPPPPAPRHHDSSSNSGDTALAAILGLAAGAAIASH